MQVPEKSASNAATQTQAQPDAVQPDAGTVSALIGMGFSENGSKRAAVATKVLRQGPPLELQQLPCKTSKHIISGTHAFQRSAHLHIAATSMEPIHQQKLKPSDCSQADASMPNAKHLHRCCNAVAV